MKKGNSYHPSIYDLGKYKTYLRYFLEFIKYGDYSSLSLSASWNYVLTGKSPSKSWQASSKLGKFNIREGSTDFLFINYTYEQKIRKYLEQEMNHITFFIDIGACIGEYSVWLAGKGIKCIAFEPVNHEAARNNLRLNGLENKVQLHHYGLWSEEKGVFFDVDRVSTGESRMDKSRIDEPGNIPITTLDKVLPTGTFNDQDHVVIKLDVEGMELEVLEGAKNILQTTKNLSVIFEHVISGTDEIKEMLQTFGNFEFIELDYANTLAIKN